MLVIFPNHVVLSLTKGTHEGISPTTPTKHRLLQPAGDLAEALRGGSKRRELKGLGLMAPKVQRIQ